MEEKKVEKELFCAPNVNSRELTCYSKEDLIFLTNAYNKKKPKSHQLKIKNNSKKDLWINLNKKLSKDCNNEWCWLEQNFVPAPYSNKKLKEKFRPGMPEEWQTNPFEWLTTTDIRKVMKQYEKRYPSFLFMGPVPSDCPSEITCSLSGLDVEILINRLAKTKLGVIYNLDKHYEPGSHWVASYFDFKKGIILYFDSVGLHPPKLIMNFLKRMKKSCEDYYINNFGTKKDVNIYVNTTRFQFGNSECGIFSMHFIISNLKGNNIYKNNKNDINDTVMNNLRKKYYRPRK